MGAHTYVHTYKVTLWSSNVFGVVSFPDHSHLQSSITCSMQIWKGKSWEIWSHAVMSEGIDTWGVVCVGTGVRFYNTSFESNSTAKSYNETFQV